MTDVHKIVEIVDRQIQRLQHAGWEPAYIQMPMGVITQYKIPYGDKDYFRGLRVCPSIADNPHKERVQVVAKAFVTGDGGTELNDANDLDWMRLAMGKKPVVKIIKDEIEKEIGSINNQFDELFQETGNKGEAMCDADGVLLSDKIKILNQLIKTIDGMIVRNEI